MLDRIAQWAALDLTGVVALPVWAIAAALAIAVLVAILALTRAGADGRSLPAVLVLIAVVGACWWVGDYLARRDRAAEQRALDARVFELATRAFMPGSALGCLDPLVAETMEDTCEKTIFASPEATAAAISYVAAQLAVLVSAGEHAAYPGMLALRRALEADRFGIVAHVLAARDGCTSDQCSAFAWLEDPSRIKVHLAERPFEARVKTYSASWPPAGSRAVATSAPASAPGAAARVPNNLYFPSASSIPPVNIMTAEPQAAQRQPQATTGAAEAAPPTPPRRPPQANAPQRQSPSAAPARSAPLPVTPAQ
jgi:hypothetical protein